MNAPLTGAPRLAWHRGRHCSDDRSRHYSNYWYYSDGSVAVGSMPLIAAADAAIGRTDAAGVEVAIAGSIAEAVADSNSITSPCNQPTVADSTTIAAGAAGAAIVGFEWLDQPTRPHLYLLLLDRCCC